jgi:hypothetical protein
MVGDFLRILRFPPSIANITEILLNGALNTNPNPWKNNNYFSFIISSFADKKIKNKHLIIYCCLKKKHFSINQH